MSGCLSSFKNQSGAGSGPTHLAMLGDLQAGVRRQALPASSIDELFDAIKGGDLKTVGELLQQGVDANAPNAAGETPLTFAAGLGQIEIARVLLLYGADELQPNAEGKSALGIAADRGDYDFVRFLLHIDQTAYGALHFPPFGADGSPSMASALEIMQQGYRSAAPLTESDIFRLTPVIPEPASPALLLLGGVLVWSWNRKSRSAAI